MLCEALQSPGVTACGYVPAMLKLCSVGKGRGGTHCLCWQVARATVADNVCLLSMYCCGVCGTLLSVLLRHVCPGVQPGMRHASLVAAVSQDPARSCWCATKVVLAVRRYLLFGL